VNQPNLVQGYTEERRAFEHLLERTLAPLMPLAITYGMKANDVALITRAVYLQVMEARLQQERGHVISAGRLALVAGLSRSEVERARIVISDRDSAAGESAEQQSRIAVVLSTWHTNPNFSGAYGVPLDLDLEPTEARPQRSFRDLIETACADLSHVVTLDELIAQGVAEVVGGELVRCKTRAAFSNSKAGKGKEALLAQYGRFLAAAAGTVAHNVTEELPNGYFDRLLVSDVPLSDRVRKQFQMRSLSSADAFLTELDSWLAKSSDQPTEGSERHYGVGVFFFEDNRDEDAASAGGTRPVLNAV
jgi:Family of unknown function (DUF6502)